MDQTVFEKELGNYSQEELRLIYATQQELYSEEELAMIAARLEPVPEPEKTSPLTVIGYILSCIVPLFGIILGLMLRTEQEPRRKRLGNDYLICGCLPAIGIGIFIGGILLFSKDQQTKTVGKKCLAASFISLMLGLFFLNGGFRI